MMKLQYVAPLAIAAASAAIIGLAPIAAADTTVQQTPGNAQSWPLPEQPRKRPPKINSHSAGTRVPCCTTTTDNDHALRAGSSYPALSARIGPQGRTPTTVASWEMRSRNPWNGYGLVSPVMCLSSWTFPVPLVGVRCIAMRSWARDGYVLGVGRGRRGSRP